MKTPVRRIVAAHEFSTLNYSLLQKLMFATSHIYGQAYIHNSLHVHVHGFVRYNIHIMPMNIAITSANYHIVICLAQFYRPAFLSLTNKAHTLCQIHVGQQLFDEKNSFQKLKVHSDLFSWGSIIQWQEENIPMQYFLYHIPTHYIVVHRDSNPWNLFRHLLSASQMQQFQYCNLLLITGFIGGTIRK